MEKITLKNEVKEIPLDDLKFVLAQVRTMHVSKDIHELAQSIKLIGQLEPIVVCPAEEKGKYEIIAGQRRYLAHRELKLKTIQAVVIERPLDEVDAKILSLTENWHRLDLSRKDEIDACLILWRRYKNVDLIIEETRLPSGRIKQYLKFESLSPSLKKVVDSGEVQLDAAVRAQKAADVGEIDDEEQIMQIAKEMDGMSQAQRKKLVKEKKDNPEADIEEIIEKAKSGEKIVQVVVTLTQNSHLALNKFAKAEETNQDEAAAGLIEEGLASKGFLESE